MKLFAPLLLFCFIHAAFCSIPDECVLEIKRTCNDEISRMNHIASIITQRDVPPLAVEIEDYNYLLQNAMNCATSIKCTKGQPILDIFKVFRRYEVAEKRFKFDDDCIRHVLEAAHNEEYYCARDYDFMTKDPARKQKAYISGKSCLVKIARGNCSSHYYDFLEEHYDDLIGTYTVQVKPDSGLCNSAYDKFDFVQCFPLASGLKTFLTGPFNLNDTQMEDFNKQCRQLQKCAEESCTYAEERGREVEDIKVICDRAESLFVHLKQDYVMLPALKGLKCIPLEILLDKYRECKEGKMECWTKFIQKDVECQNKIVEMLADWKLIAPDECKGKDCLIV